MGFKSNNKKKKFRNPIKPLEIVSSEDGKSGQQVKDPTILPKTFQFAADTLKIMKERSGSVGSIVVNKYKSYNYKLIYALVMNTVKNIKIIKKIIHNLKLMNSTPEDNPFLIEIMLGDLLYGQGLKSVEKNPIAVSIKDKKDAILKEQSALKKEFPAQNDESVPKYLRVNHLKSDMSHVLARLKALGLSQVDYSKDKIKFKKFINKYKNLEANEFMLDFHFPNDLIVMKPETAQKVTKSDLIKKSKATFQDKASFLAVEALDVKPSQNVIDACFAPAGKTCLIAGKMHNKGKILAYDMDKKRLVSAIGVLKFNDVTCVKHECMDFSKVKLRRLPKIHKIEHFDSILIDPSCSGSGIKSRLDYKKSDEEKGRLLKLRAFQVSLLKHALRARVSKTIVYCTCSTQIEENEQVVEMALNECGAKDKWEIVDAVPYWPQRGDSNFEFGAKCLRSDSENLTNGFFIAKFECKELLKSNSADDELDDKANKKRQPAANGNAKKKPKPNQQDPNAEDEEEMDNDDNEEDAELSDEGSDDDDDEVNSDEENYEDAEDASD